MCAEVQIWSFYNPGEEWATNSSLKMIILWSYSHWYMRVSKMCKENNEFHCNNDVARRQLLRARLWEYVTKPLTSLLSYFCLSFYILSYYKNGNFSFLWLVCEEQNFGFILPEVVQIFTHLDLKYLCSYDPATCPTSWEHFKIFPKYVKKDDLCEWIITRNSHVRLVLPLKLFVSEDAYLAKLLCNSGWPEHTRCYRSSADR